MKHFYRIFLAALCLMTFWTSGYAINPYLQGDVNDDARVSIDDVTDLINALLDGTTSDFDGYGDVNGDRCPVRGIAAGAGVGHIGASGTLPPGIQRTDKHIPAWCRPHELVSVQSGFFVFNCR